MSINCVLYQMRWDKSVTDCLEHINIIYQIKLKRNYNKYEQFMEQWLVNNSCCDTLYKIEWIVNCVLIKYFDFEFEFV